MRTVILTLAILLTNIVVKAQATDPWTEYMMPAEMHKMLEKYTGNFSMEITMWMAEDQKPMITKVNSTHKMIFSGRFLEMTQTGDMMGFDFQSIMTIGFNNSSKKFALTNITNMGTGILSLTGDWDEKSRSTNLTGQLINPVNKKPINVRQKISFIDNNTLLIENFDQEGDKKERKSIQYKLTRI